jgi:hypothetical protein
MRVPACLLLALCFTPTRTLAKPAQAIRWCFDGRRQVRTVGELPMKAQADVGSYAQLENFA